MKIQNLQYHPKGVLDGSLTRTLRLLNTNPAANAVGIDLVAMVAPRTYVDTKERNKYAGAETFFREFTGTLTVCLSASYFAKMLAKISNKFINPAVPINTNSLYSNNSLAFLNNMPKYGTEEYVSNVFDSLFGTDGSKTNYFNKIKWDNIDWIDEKKFTKIKWDDKKYQNIYNGLKSKEALISAASELIDNKNISKKDKKNLITIIGSRIVNALGSENITAEYGSEKTSAPLSDFLRDTMDFGRDILKSEQKDIIINKLLKINKIKALGAITLSSVLGLLNQYINRKITEKRTGKKGFVGAKNYMTNKEQRNDETGLFKLEKAASSAGMVIMTAGVMNIKSSEDFMRKLEFTRPVTGGNAIKTVYAATLIGRFLAADNKDELRESVTRDYLGFLNWLVLGGFASKAAANILDTKRKTLFNEKKAGTSGKNRITHWFNDISLKSHNEIASKGENFAKKNIWKLNLSMIAGLVYSTIALGFLLPKLNIFITNKKEPDDFITGHRNDEKYKTLSGFASRKQWYI